MRPFAFVIAVLLIAFGVAHADEQQSPPLIINVTSDRQEAYLNEQVLVKVELKVRHDAFGVTQSPFATDIGKVFSVHKEEFKEIVDNAEYRTIQRTYALFPSETGTHALPTVTALAQTPVNSTGNNLRRNPKVRVESGEINLSVKQPPPGNAVWLPASKVMLSRKWVHSGADTDALLTKGEPVKLRITIDITGQHPTAVPDITPSENPNWRFYAEPAQWNMQISPDGLAGTVSKDISLVPTVTGETTLPGFVVRWWDSNQKQWRESYLRSKTVQITDASELQNQHVVWKRMGWGLAAITILSVLVYGFKQWLSRPTEHRAWRNVLRGLRKQNPAQLKQAVIEWHAFQPQSLSEIEQVTNNLNETLYHPAATLINWQNLRANLLTAKRKAKHIRKLKRKKSIDLASLYS